MKVTLIPIVIGALGTLSKEAGSVRNGRKNLNHLKYRIAEIGQTTEKSPGGSLSLILQ